VEGVRVGGISDGVEGGRRGGREGGRGGRNHAPYFYLEGEAQLLLLYANWCDVCDGARREEVFALLRLLLGHKQGPGGHTQEVRGTKEVQAPVGGFGG